MLMYNLVDWIAPSLQSHINHPQWMQWDLNGWIPWRLNFGSLPGVSSPDHLQ